MVSMGLCRWSPWVSAGGLRGSLQVVVGKINQSKSVPMMSLNVVGNINLSNSRCLCRSPWVSAGGLCGFPWVSVGGLHRSLWVVVGKINQSKSVPMMSLNVVGNINQSNSRCLCGSPWVVSAGLHGLHGWFCGFLQVSTGGLHRSLWVVVGTINQSKSVPMRSLVVVGRMNQSKSILMMSEGCTDVVAPGNHRFSG